MTALITQGELCVYGDGTHQRDYIHVSDVVEANLAAVRHHLQGIFVVGTGVPTTTLQLAKMCIALEPNSAMTFMPGEPLEQKRSFLNAALLQTHSDWKANISLQDGLAQTLAWYRNAT
jgi:UDP-glucose 4-epimerase